MSHTRSKREDATARLSISTAATFPGTSADPAQGDINMILQMANKDHCEFEQLYRRFYRPVLSISRGILRNAEDAEEAAADTIFEAWRRAKSFEPEAGTLFSWVMMIARCRAIDRLRSKSRRREESLDSFCDLASSSMDSCKIPRLQIPSRIGSLGAEAVKACLRLARSRESRSGVLLCRALFRRPRTISERRKVEMILFHPK